MNELKEVASFIPPLSHAQEEDKVKAVMLKIMYLL